MKINACPFITNSIKIESFLMKFGSEGGKEIKRRLERRLTIFGFGFGFDLVCIIFVCMYQFVTLK